MATIRDIAEGAGVSIATVSRVVNGSLDVNAATRERVLRVAGELNYQPHASARNLRRATHARAGLNYCIMLLVCRGMVFDTTLFSIDLMAGIEQAARERGFGLRILTCSPDGDVPREIREGEVDGAISIGVGPVIKAIGQRVPTVTVDGYWPELEVFGLVPDYRKGVYEATTRLLAAGHRRIHQLSSDDDDTQGYRFGAQVFSGYAQAHRDAGIALPESAFPGTAMRPADGYALGGELFACRDARPDALLASDDAVPGLYRAAHEHGVRIPDDVSIIGIDGISLGDYLTPRLTTVDTHVHSTGVLAANTIIESAESNTRRQGFLLTPVTLVIRDSARL